MSTSEECTQLSQGLQNSIDTTEQDSILSKDEEQIPNIQNDVSITDNGDSSFIHSASPTEIATAQQSDTLNSTLSFHGSSLHKNSIGSLDTTPDTHTIDLPPSSPDALSQDSQNIEENGKDIEVRIQLLSILFIYFNFCYYYYLFRSLLIRSILSPALL